MFCKATAHFVQHIEPDGSLIHVSGPNDSRKLILMALVVKRNRFWFWQRPKYQPTDFTLSDLLLGDKELTPEVCETDFLTYEGTFGGTLSGSLNTHRGPFNVELEGRGTSELQSCFGKLKKEELDVSMLSELCDSGNRLVNMQHKLMQQLEKKTAVLTLVKERILTTSSCSVTQTKAEQCTFQGVFGLLAILGSAIKDRNKIKTEVNVCLKIPSDTVIAYSVLELRIKNDGHFDLCLQPGTIGGFEAVHESSADVVDAKYNWASSSEEVSAEQLNGSQDMDLSLLADLPHSTQQVLFQMLREMMQDRAALSYLQCELEELCSAETPMKEELVKGPRSVSAHLNQPSLDSLSLTECNHSPSAAHLNAIHLLVSAMEELPNETLNLLSKSSVDFLGAFNTLMCKLKESSGPLPVQCLPVLLQDVQGFQLAEQLLGSIDVTLKRNTDSLWIEKRDEVLPLLLSLSTKGLFLLCHGLN